MNDEQEHELDALRARVQELEHQLALAQTARNSTISEEQHREQVQAERERLLEALGDQVDRAEIDALRAEERAGTLAAIIDAMVNPVLIVDETGLPIFANMAAELALGMDPLQLKWNNETLSFFTRLEDGRAPRVDELPITRALHGEKISGETFVYRDAAGEEHTVLVSAGPVKFRHESAGIDRDGAVASWHDITERSRLLQARERAEQALRKSEQSFRELADSMPQLVWMAGPDGELDYFNNRRSEYSGIEHAAGEAAYDWAAAIHPQDLERTRQLWQQAVQEGVPYQIEHRVCMADGRYRWHLSRGVPVRDNRGRVVKWFGTATDIDDSKAAEAALRRYAERLENSNRNLQEFAFVASHDLQEPLRKIEMFGDLLLQRSDNLDDHQRDFLARMRDAAHRMRAMVDGLLQLSRLTTRAQPFEAVELRQVVDDVLDALETSMRLSGAKIEVGDLPAVNADPLQMRQLFQNLLSNAIKFQPPGRQPQLRVRAAPINTRWVEIVVEDNGIGFDPEQAEGLFQPFQRLVGRSQYPGSGMGLAICRRIVERHGGTITADAIPGQGASMRIRLPKLS